MFNMNKKGLAAFFGILAVIVWIIIAFVTILFFALWIFGHGLITNTLLVIPSTAEVNISSHVQNTFVQVDNSLSQLRIIAFIIIIGQAFAIFIFNFFKREHPIIFIVYLFMNIVAVVFAVIISNVYEELLNNALIGSTLESFTAGTFLMLNLPFIAAVIGFFGLIFLLVGVSRDSEQQGGGIIG